MSSSNKKTTNLPSKDINAFEGIIIGVFEDNGPIARYNHIKLSKKLINRLVIHGMSAVHGGDDMIGGLYGPLPLFEKPKHRYLIFSFKVVASNTKDQRIAEHGRNCSIFLIIKSVQQRFILNNHLSIEKILNEFVSKNWQKELAITEDSTLVLLNTLNDIVKIVDLRVFSYGQAGLIEFADPQTVLDEGILTIFDLKNEKAYIYLPKENFSSKIRISAVEKIEEINLREFGSRLKIIKVRDYVGFKKILDTFSIQLVK
ncbi:MAG: hypothetical protein ACFFDW_10480 [Candidatus Thorarchaeota archaeon]